MKSFCHYFPYDIENFKISVRTETICMFGIVPVRVKGSIHRGDVLHSSETHPGAAVSGSAFTQAQVMEYATIGFALETMECDDDEVIVPCFIVTNYFLFVSQA